MFRPKTRHSRISFLILASSVLLPATAAESQVFIRTVTGTTNDLRAVDFIDDSLGLVAGDFGTILRTTDGGTTWAPAPSGTSSHLHCVCWLSPSTAVAAGFSGVILRSADAGMTWTAVPSGTALPLAGCAFRDSLGGIVVGYNGIILRTADGGLSWTTAFQQNGSNHLGASYADSLSISVSGTYGRMLRSTDGGLSWTGQSYGSYTLNDVEFIDPANGIAVGSGGNVVLRTSDAGASWTPGLLTGTFDDIDHAPDRSVAATGTVTIFSDDDGSTWSVRELQARLRAVAVFDSSRCILVGDDGMALRTASGPFDPPPPELSHPADGAPDAPLSPDWQKEFSLALSWRDYDAYFPDSVRLQVSDQPDFSGAFLHDSTYRIVALPDTHRLVRRVFPGKPHFWRIRMIIGGIESPWSETWSFSGSIAGASYSPHDIQAVPPESLALADSLTALARDRWLLQASPLFEEMVFAVLRCVADPADLYNPHHIYEGASSGQFFYAVDTGNPGPAWRGIRVTPGWFSGSNDLVEAFARVRAGDLVVCAGVISEDPWMSMNSETSLFAHWLFVVDSSGAIPPPAPATVSDFFHRPGQDILPRYATGEPFEGGYVELTDLTVHSVDGGTYGTFNVTGRDGLAIGTADYSRWFTLRAHRDPASDFAVPPVGTPIDTLRGFISTTSGDAVTWTFPRYRIVPVDPGDVVYGAPTGNVLRGSVYYDSSRNGIREPGEPGIGGWQLFLGGLVSATLETAPDGSFSAPGIDSGQYSLSLDLPEGWFVSTPGPTTIGFSPGLADTVEPPPFGIYYGWNSIAGTAFEDTNENGSRDPGEPGLPGILVRLQGATPDSTVTDDSGEYIFDRLRKGRDTVFIRIPPRWEQIVPANDGGNDVDFREYDRHVTGCDFSLRHVPYRVKVSVTVRDSGDVTARDVVFGTRPGASYGIWGTAADATFIDFSEGEFEIPPQIFGLFDARLVDPRGGTEMFGEGTWTDVREYRSAGQTDSFRLDFQPALLLGGNYPMRFFWSRAVVESSYAGPVTLTDSAWGPILDMKTAEAFSVTNTETTVLGIIAEGPVLRLSDVTPGPAPAPSDFALLQNYPNPFNPETSIPYEVSTRGRVALRIYDVLGREVRTLVDEEKPPGRYAERWAPGTIPTGVYYCRMTAGGFHAVRKLLLLR